MTHTLITFLVPLATFVSMFYALLGSFLIYAAVHRNWSKLKPVTKFLLGPFIGLYPIDVVFNVVFGSIMFLEFPAQLTFSERCNLHTQDTNWRGSLAGFFCENLNTFDPGHCSRYTKI